MVRLVVREGASLGVDPSRLAVGGDSAGANLALAAALALRDVSERALSFMLLIYGCYSTDTKSHSWQRFGRGSGLSQTQALDLGDLSRTFGAAERLARRAAARRSCRPAESAAGRPTPRPAGRRQPTPRSAAKRSGRPAKSMRNLVELGLSARTETKGFLGLWQTDGLNPRRRRRRITGSPPRVATGRSAREFPRSERATARGQYLHSIRASIAGGSLSVILCP